MKKTSSGSVMFMVISQLGVNY